MFYFLRNNQHCLTSWIIICPNRLSPYIWLNACMSVTHDTRTHTHTRVPTRPHTHTSYCQLKLALLLTNSVTWIFNDNEMSSGFTRLIGTFLLQERKGHFTNIWYPDTHLKYFQCNQTEQHDKQSLSLCLCRVWEVKALCSDPKPRGVYFLWVEKQGDLSALWSRWP